MRKTTSLLIMLVVLALLLGACGPETITPTPGADSATITSPPPTESAGETPGSEQPTSRPPLVDADDWRLLGSSDAPVTMVEYSDFQ